jgi:hypothetical protein
LEGILTYWGLKPPQSPSIHMDWGRTEQALIGFVEVIAIWFQTSSLAPFGEIFI